MSSRVVPSQRGGPSALTRVTRTFKKHKKLTIGALLWAFGLYCVFFAPAPVKLTREAVDAFHTSMKEVENVESKLMHAHALHEQAYLDQNQHMVWFWRFRPEHRKLVKEKQPAVDAAYATIRDLGRVRDRHMRNAKRNLGVWSDAGVEESRAMLWKSFESGKVFAQRQTFWDAFFTILNSRDRDWVSMLLDLLFRALTNFTIGSVMAVITFIFSLPSFLSGYGAGIFSGTVFFVVASVAGLSLIASYLSLIYASGAAVVYGAASLVDLQRQRLAYEQQERLRGEHGQYGRRPHGD